jgi:beta-glucosidase
MPQSYAFPAGFVWGAATASYQIEGAIAEDGRSPSVWDTFATRLHGTRTGESGAVACDHYHRWREDIQLMKSLGLKAYRFSVAWPRVIPGGTGAVNAAGLDFYSRLVDGLLEAGITPHVTLFHWDSPQALEDRYGSWRSRQMARDFADYCTVVVKRLGDRVTDWMTINEVPCFTTLGYGVGKQPPHAPGTIVKTEKEVWQTVHHAMLAHGLACQAVRAASPRPCRVALVDNCAVPVPWAETEADIAAARIAFQDMWANGAVSFPALTGRYSDLFTRRKSALGAMPDIAPGDLETIRQPLDAYGLNIYSGTYVRAAANPDGFELIPYAEGYPRLDMPWLQVVPEAIYWAARHVVETCGFQGDLFVSENGCAAQDALTASGEVLDNDRIHYLRSYLRQTHRLCAEGYRMRGYFQWSLMDNFEWAWGYAKRFGMVFTNYQTQERTPKLSAQWYAECIRQNRVV